MDWIDKILFFMFLWSLPFIIPLAWLIHTLKKARAGVIEVLPEGIEKHLSPDGFTVYITADGMYFVSIESAQQYLEGKDGRTNPHSP